ncbi:MAG: multiheme c-type cytochrome [Nitrospiraceae bacterium]|nr:multiheme c-type cytochrome [Nitrospiraceae bacterium]
MRKRKLFYALLAALIIFITAGNAFPQETGAALSSSLISPQSRKCIECHSRYSPGIVNEWLSGSHSRITPDDALRKPSIERMFSARSAPGGSGQYVTGCYECHGVNTGAHKDSFRHFGTKINVIVSPADCALCHPVEQAEFNKSKESFAWSNLENNPLFHTLMDTVIGTKEVSDSSISIEKPMDGLAGSVCYGCHGDKIKAAGMKQLSTPVGIINVPDLKGWPNTGIGRVNPDGSMGACEACHPGHSFSIEDARKPYTCARCHTGPHAPAWDVYQKSSHGVIFLSNGTGWNFTRVPWRPGTDFKAPTCAACHNSLLTGPDGKVLAERTHDSGSRLWVRLLGLIYSTAQTKSGDTTMLKNKDGLPLPSSFEGEPGSKYLISKTAQTDREDGMKAICNSCHASQWTNGHFTKMDESIQAADNMTHAATKLVQEAWRTGVADETNPFNEQIEMDWVRQWFFYATDIKYAAAMSGASDYSAFKNGFWNSSQNLLEMEDLSKGPQVVKVAPKTPKLIGIPEIPFKKTSKTKRKAKGKSKKKKHQNKKHKKHIVRKKSAKRKKKSHKKSKKISKKEPKKKKSRKAGK